jgi:hypothetical protein
MTTRTIGFGVVVGKMMAHYPGFSGSVVEVGKAEITTTRKSPGWRVFNDVVRLERIAMTIS